MGFVFASARKDLARWSQDRASMLIWLGIPFLIGGLITSMIGGGGRTPSGILLLVDQDESMLSGLVAGAYSQGDLAELITVREVDLDEGEALVEAGEASGLLIIPDGFGDAFVNETPVTLTLKTNPSQTILPGIIEDVTEILLDAGFYAQQIIGPQIRQIQEADLGGVPTDVFVAAIAVQIQNRIEAVAPKLFPPVIDVQIVEPPPAEPQPDFALLYLPGIVLMAILFAANSLAADYWQERDNGSLRRLVSAPGQLYRFVAGKALAAATVFFALSLLTLMIGFAYHGVAWAKLPSSLLWLAVSGTGLFAWFAALQMMFPNQKAANLVTTILLFPLLMAGGSFFPLAALPDFIASIGRMAPNGFVADRLTNELTSATPWSFGPDDWLIVLLMTITGLAVCALRLGTGVARR